MIIDEIKQIDDQVNVDELEDGLHNWKRLLARGHSRQTLAHANRIGQFLFVQRFESRLVIEQVYLRRTARHE